MAGILYFLVFEVCGMGIVHFLLPRVRPIARGWLGLCLGLALMMWLPALFAFLLKFTVAAHLCALLLIFLLTGGAWYFRQKGVESAAFSDADKQLGRMLLSVALPLTVLGAYLQYTHVLRPTAEGALYVGQSTYGDLPLHLSIATSLRNAAFPPDYSILPGALLTYPFLTDSLSTSFLLMGCSLQIAMVFPGIVMMGLTFSGYLILAERMAKTWKGAVLAALFFFINGGLGFVYLFDMQGMALGTVGQNELQSVEGLWERIRLVMNGWYQTPANHAEFTTYNLRWSNVIADMMIPQRTTLGGWCQVIPCIYLLYDSLLPQGQALPEKVNLNKDGPVGVFIRREVPCRQLILLGIWAGMLPMINTHCFLALGLLSAGWMAYDFIRCRGQRKKALLHWGIFGGLAVLCAAPQLFTWTFNQAVGNENFLQFQFNWVNGSQGMLDGYFWFYLKNIGIPFVLILLALLEKNQKRRFLASGAFVIFLAAELIQFQPNIYDNNKLLYIWYMICCVIAADYGLELLGKLKGLRAKPVIAALCAFACFFTGALSIAHEAVSNWQMFSKAEVEAADYIEESTPEHAVFLSGTQHINFVSSLAGRRIVCGPDTWLYFHGFNTWDRQADIRAFYADPYGNLEVLAKYDVDYILVGNSERSSMTVDTYALDRYFEKVYEIESGWDKIVIYSAEMREDAW